MMSDLILFGLTALAYMSFSTSRKKASHDLQQALKEGTSRDALEQVCTVDEHNTPTATGHTRAEMRLNNLWHRATYILVRHETEEGDFYLVQRRTMLKDYCPGKLDPTPGGVVGFGESYLQNATREIEEEMGIDVSENSPHSLTKLFNFPYQDDKVRCWGGFYEAIYRGSMDDIVIQEEEVDEVLRLSLDEIQTWSTEKPEDWMPDALHALRLYLQYVQDRTVNRRLLKGYSSGNLDHYKLRPKPAAIFFDCDDCLYFDDWKVAEALTIKMNEWCMQLGLEEGAAYELYHNYGTTLRGLLAEGHIEHSEEAVDDFLSHVHDIPIAKMLERDDALRKMISSIDPSIPKYIFTASVKHHAERCLRAIGLDGMFVDIIDVKACNLYSKHTTQAFETAMRVAGVDNPEQCLFLDDSVKNIHAARKVGWRSVLVGRVGRDCGTTISSEHAEMEIESIHELPEVMPELFESSNE